MSSLANEKPNAVHHESLGNESTTLDADTPSSQQHLPNTSNDTTTSSSSYDSRQPEDIITAKPSETMSQVIDIPNVNTLQSRFKTLKVSCPPNIEEHGEQRRQQQQQQHNFHQFQGTVPQVASYTPNDAYLVANQYFHGGGVSRFPSSEVQPILHPPQQVNMHYTGTQPPPVGGVIYPSQYGIGGGYPYNPSILPSFLAGYPPHTTPPLAAVDVNTQQVCNYGQLGGFSPPFIDPRLQFHHSFNDPYTIPGQLDPSSAMAGGGHHQRRGGGGDYVGGNSMSMGFYMPVPSSTLASPVFPGSPIGVNNFPGGRSDVSSPNSGRSSGFYGGWHGQRGNDSLNFQKPYSFLEELKSGKGRRFELSDITGHVVEFSVDQHGSRFIQQKLENCGAEDKASVFQEVVPHACRLMTDVFGNYVIQKFFEYGTSDQRRDLAKALAGEILPLSLQMYGCRVIQKALDVIEVDQKIDLVRELDGHVMRCVRDQNGNHVIQKCIECVPSERIGFIISAFRGQVASLSMHPYGCRVIQRVLEHCTDELQSQFIVDEILESVCTLAQDQYGNYVTQHVLERGKPEERTQIIKNLSGQVVKMSQHKFASNVVEKCLEYGDPPSRELLIAEVVGEETEGSDNLLVMMKDQYANYVVQKILEKCAESQRELLLGRIREHLNALKKYTYGKHIVARFEQLFGEMEEPTS